MEAGPMVRARVFASTPGHWYWSYEVDYGDGPIISALRHGPFASQPEALSSAERMVKLL